MANHAEINLTVRDVIHHDDHCLAVNKAAGWPVHATRDPNRPHVEGAARTFLASMATTSNPTPYVAVVHRIDVWTSGIVLLVTRRDATQALTTAFEDRNVAKRYLGICVGGPNDDSGQLKHYLAKRRQRGRDIMNSVRSSGKVALSRYRVLGRGDGLSLVEFELLTGRTHQLRVQAATEGWPILGDDVYGDGYNMGRGGISSPHSVSDGGPRRPGQLLHAHSLSFEHPVTGRTVFVEAPLPDDFETYARRLLPTGI